MVVALTGFMACGKTTFGKAAAEALGCRFIDLDDEIAARHGTPDAIFGRGGESLFRELETSVLKDVLGSCDNCILALGGGTILSETNRNILKNSGVHVIWLDTSFEIICTELSNSSRPVIKSKGIDEIRALYELRLPVYASAADSIIRTDSTDYGRTVASLTERVRTILCL